MGNSNSADVKWLQLSGRLGNELFQWSYAHNVAVSHSCVVNLFHDKYHQSSRVNLDFLSRINCQHVNYIGHANKLGFELKLLDWLGSYSPRVPNALGRSKKWYRALDANTAQLPPPSALKYSGFFQNFRQVENISGTVISELREILDPIYLKFKDQLPPSFQFAHVRRGDLVGLNNTYGLLGTDWYKSCRDSSLPLVLSSDDLEACQDVIAELKPNVILNPKSYSAFTTLALMSKSKDLIMANSTLSWWGGYLANKNDAIVHFPDPFFKGNLSTTQALCTPNFERKISIFV